MTENSQKHTLPNTTADSNTVDFAIKNEDELQEKIEEAKAQSKNSIKKERFKELEDTIHSFLAKQDSDSTLTIITK